MKKAISLLTSLMVMSLVAANMAIPASADGGVTFDIDDVTVNLEDLSTDANGNYIVNVPVFSTDTTDTGSYSSVLKFDFAKEGVGYVSDGDSMVFVENGGVYAEKDISSTVEKERILYLNGTLTPESRPVNGTETIYTLQLTIPSTAKAGDTFALNWDDSVVDVTDLNEEDLSSVVTLENGSITVGGETPADTDTTTGVLSDDGMVIKAEDVVLDTDEIAEDTTVKVPIKVTNNVGFASGLWANTLTSNSSVTATWSKDFVGVADGDLFGAKDVEGNAPNGRVLYLNSNTQNVSEDGTLCYVEVVIPAGAKAGDTFEVGFDNSVADYTNADEQEIPTPTYVGGTITIGSAVPDTTTTTVATEVTEVVTTTGASTGSMNISASNKDVDVTDILSDGVTSEELTVQVPIVVTGNTGFASGLWANTLTSNSSVTATWSDTFVATADGDLFGAKDVEGYASNGRVLYLNSNTEDVTGDGSLCYVEVVIPAGAKVGDTFEVGFDSSVADYTNASEEELATPTYVGGTITIVGGTDTEPTTTTTVATTAPVTEPTTTTTPLATTTVTTTTVTSNTSFEPTATTTAVTQPTTVTTTSNVATDGITLTADNITYDISDILADGVTKKAITVNVPIKVVNNPGFASGLWGLTLSSDSSVTAGWSEDFAVVDENCIADSKEIEGVVSTQRVLYLSNTATDLTKDGTICYVQVVIPAGAKVGDKFNVGFNENVNDFSNEAGDVVTPKFAGGVIVLGNGSDTPTTTTSVTTPNVTTTTNGSVTTTTGKGDTTTTTTTSGKGDTTTTTAKGNTTTTTAKGTGNNNNNNGTTTTKGSNSSANTGSTGIVGTVLAMISAGAAALIAKKKRK